jgi:hypothetical protein
VRYDSGWRSHPPSGGYDRDFSRGWRRGNAQGDRDQGARFFEGPPEGEAFGLHGPARYGLGPYHERLRRRKRPDDELKGDVEEALFYDTWVDADAIRVSVRDGVVTLQGELPSYEEIRFATDDAWDVEGVVGVRTELRLRER